MHDNPVDTRSWAIGLDSWVIQDGNYPDLVTGQRIDFALEFASRGGLTRLDEAHEVAARWVGGSHYEVTAQIVHDAPNAQVLDFGILAYHFIGIEDPKHQSQVGAWVTGEINLSVDPFFYFDQLANEAGFPDLTYAWTLQEVLQKTAENGFVRIENTDAWGDLRTLPSYLLRCRLERAPGPRARAASASSP